MKVSKAVTTWIDYHRVQSPPKKTVRSYKPIIDRFCLECGDFEIDQVSSTDSVRA